MRRPDVVAPGATSDALQGRLPTRMFDRWRYSPRNRNVGKPSGAAMGPEAGGGQALPFLRCVACAVLLGANFAVAGCSGGSGGQQLAAVVTDTALPARHELQPSSDAVCITLHDGTCTSQADFDDRAHALAENYAAHDQYKNQWGLAAIGADRAYAHVDLLKGEQAAPGAGVTIGFLDSGIDLSHPMFTGKRVTEVLLSGAVDETGDGSSHGTAVASVAAGTRDLPSPLAPHGVAWGADIAMFAIPLGSGDGTYTPVSLEDMAAYDASSAQEFRQVLGWRDGRRRVDVLNLSLGYQGIIDGYSEAGLRASIPETIAALAQDGASEKAILVWAAGNANGDPCDPSIPHCETGSLDAVSASVLSGLAARIPELKGHTVAVVALAPADELALKPSDASIAWFSNRCGIAADFCLAAPGQQVAAAYFGPDPETGEPSRSVGEVDGTSFAAPIVSGGFAIMKQLFRDQLANEELVTRLLETADNTGLYANRAIYGRGRLDLAAATHPVGVPAVPAGMDVQQAGYDLRTTYLSLGTPFGSGLGASVLGRELMALDDLGAPFWYRLGDFIAPAPDPGVDTTVLGFLANRLDGGAWQPGAWTLLTAAVTEGGHLSLAEGGKMATFVARSGLSVSMFGANRGERGVSGGAVGWRPEGAPLGLRVGWIAEDATLLGGAGQGAFGALNADTVFVRLEGAKRVGAWRLGAGAEWGSVRPQVRGGIIEDISTLTTSAFALRARTTLPNQDRMSVSLSQPLRVEHGRASLALPVARTKVGQVRHTTVDAALAPDERQIDLAVTWERTLVSGPLRLGFIWSHDPDHGGAADPGLTFLAGWRRAL